MHDISNFKNRLQESIDALEDNIYKNKITKDIAKKVLTPLIQAIVKNNKIVLIGDYDVDGFFSALELKIYLNSIADRLNIEANIEIIYSSRFDGYSYPKEKFKELSTQDNFIVFLDTGSGYEYLEKHTKNVLVIDHHPVDREDLPKYIFNPNQDHKLSTSNGYVVYELCNKFEETLLQSNIIAKKVETPFNYMHLLAGITLISDMAEMNKSNITFVEETVKIAKKARKHFKWLNEIFGEINATAFSFNVINMINSYSRMNKPLEDILPIYDMKVKKGSLVYPHNKSVIEDAYSDKLLATHNERKKLLKEKEKKLYEDFSNDKTSVLKTSALNFAVVSDGHTGLNGLLAQMLFELSGKNSIVVSCDNISDSYSGSGRGTNIKDVLDSINIGKFGGHKAACGISLKHEELIAFGNKILKQNIEIENSSDNNEIYFLCENISDYKDACRIYKLFSSVKLTKKFFAFIPNVIFEDPKPLGKSAFVQTIVRQQNNTEYLGIMLKEIYTKDLFSQNYCVVEIDNETDNKKFLPNKKNSKNFQDILKKYKYNITKEKKEDNDEQINKNISNFNTSIRKF